MTGNPDNLLAAVSSFRASHDKRIPDRALVHTWVLVPGFEPYVAALRQKFSDIPKDADAGIGYIYIDHDAGISMKVVCLCRSQDQRMTGDGVFPLENLVSLRFRYPSLQALQMKKITEDEMKQSGLPASPGWLSPYNPPDLKTIREFEWLDPFRAHGFFDDVMATLPAIGEAVPELIWVRLLHYFEDTDRFHGVLLNEPFRDYGVHRNDIIEVLVERDYNGITLVAVPCRISRDCGADTNPLKNLPQPGDVP